VITAERLREVLDYDPETGVFTWAKGGYGIFLGSIAGCKDKGYIRIKVDGKIYGAHRLAWLYVNGTLPDGDIDHINRVRTDNRISNLRVASKAENAQNKSKYRNNKSGIVGVYWDNLSKKWRAQIRVNGIAVYLGCYRDIDEAKAARSEAKAKYHKFHPEVA
jgi:hypothetical protein